MKSSTNALDGTTSFSYDKYGNLVKETDPLGRSNTYSYDLAGQMTSAADPLGKITATPTTRQEILLRSPNRVEERPAMDMIRIIMLHL